MRIEPLSLSGTFCIVPEQITDERGFFARTVCSDELSAHGLIGQFKQSSLSFNKRQGTVRGMHYSVAPYAETKIVRCTAGAVHDVLVDLRPDSPTYLGYVAVELTARNRHAVYIPTGIAHGFQTLQNDTEVLYMIDVPYVAASARGVRWNDPHFKLRWPEKITTIASRDLAYPDLDIAAIIGEAF